MGGLNIYLLNQLSVDSCRVVDFGELVKKARSQKFKSARSFWESQKLSCSYYYYSKVEQETVPTLGIALEIIEALGMNKKESLYAWARDQMPDSETRAYFTLIGSDPSLSTESKTMGKALVINRMQAKLLQENPVYFEILLFIYCHHDLKKLTLDEIAKEFKTEKSEMVPLLKTLFDHALVEKNLKGQYHSRKWIYIPYDEEFCDLRDSNFKRAVDQFLKTRGPTHFRTTITRFMTPEQIKQTESFVTALHHAIIDLPDQERKKNVIPVTLGAFLSERRFGDG